MLDRIREKFQGWLALLIIALIAIPLVVTFGQMEAGTSANDFVARVNGEDIPPGQFQRVLQAQLAARQQAAAGELTPEVEDQVKREVLDGLILNQSVSQYVRGAGYRVGDGRVVESIQSAQAFQVGGQFSRNAYEAALTGQGVSPAAFEAEQRSVLSIQQMQAGLVASAFYTPAEYRRLLELEGERREAAYVLLDPKLIGASVAISDADVAAYFAANAAEFKSAETVTLEYVEANVAEVGGDVTPSDEDLRKAYDSDPSRFRTEEERRARHILINVTAARADAAAKQLADQLARELASGADFAQLAAKYSADTGSAAQGGDLGWAGRGQFVPEFEAALFGLAVGQVSPPVKTQFGYHLIRLDEVRPGTVRTFDDVRDELIAELKQQKSQDAFYAIAERLDDLALENPTSLEPVAKATGLTVRRVTGFGREGGGAFGKNAKLISAVFSGPVLESAENTPVIELDPGRAIVARVADYQAPQPRPLADVRGDIVERLRAIRGSTEATRRGQAILTRVQGGTALPVAAAEQGSSAVSAGYVTRGAQSVPSELLGPIFRAPKPASGRPGVLGVELPTGAYVVVQVSDVISGDPDAIPREVRDQRKRQLAQQSGAADVEALAADVKNSAKVTVAKTLFKKADDS